MKHFLKQDLKHDHWYKYAKQVQIDQEIKSREYKFSPNDKIILLLELKKQDHLKHFSETARLLRF